MAPLDRVRYALANADYLKVLDLAASGRLPGSGAPGSAKLRKALERHEPKLARTRSPLERLFLPLCERYGIPLPDDVNVRIAGVLVDAVSWQQKLVVELDGRDNHSSWAQIQRDRSNELRLRAAGFDVIRYGTVQLEEQPALVAGDVIRRSVDCGAGLTRISLTPDRAIGHARMTACRIARESTSRPVAAATAASASAARRTCPRAGRTGATAVAAATSCWCATTRCATSRASGASRTSRRAGAATGRGRCVTARTGRRSRSACRRGPRRSSRPTAPCTTWSAPGQRAVVARGGPGGRGNKRFAGPTHQTPRFAEKGLPGEETWITLQLKLLADVGLVGLPNAGKSSLLGRLTRAHPKVADYPFTTLEPALGTLEADDRQLVIADIPGLIEGASAGAGLGHDFLAHIERTRLLVHVLDLAPLDGSDPEVNYATVERELELHNPRLSVLPRVLALSKADLVDEVPGTRRASAGSQRLGPDTPVIVTSSATGLGLGELARELLRRVPEEVGGRRARRSDRAARHRAGRRARRAPRVPAGGGPRLPGREGRRAAPTELRARGSSGWSRATTSTTTTRSRTSSGGCAGSA